MRKIEINFTLNGKRVTVRTYPNRRLLDLLREDLGITGPKSGCDIGECGACTVILNQKAVNSCLVLAPEVDGGEVITVEGLAEDKKLHPLQESFIEADAVHCGFCTPGLLMTAKYLLDNKPKPSRDEIIRAIEGNLCRCTGYWPIVRAIELASEKMKEMRNEGKED